MSFTRMLVAEPESLATLVAGETSRVEAELSARQRTLLSLRHIAASGSLAPYAIEETQESRLPIARIDGVTNSERLVPDTTELVYAVLSEMDRQGIEVAGPVGYINEFEREEDRVAVAAFAAVPAGGVELGRRMVSSELPSARCATLVHIGPYETLGLAHHALHAWAHERGREPEGPIWEFYLNDPSEADATALETRIALPLR